MHTLNKRRKKQPATVLDVPPITTTPALVQLHAILQQEELAVTEMLQIAGYAAHVLRRAFKGENSPRIGTIEDIANTMGYTLRLVPLDNRPEHLPPRPYRRRSK